MSETRSFHDGRVVLHAGDCLAVLDTLPENSVDSVCVDPPYHLTSIVKRFSAVDAAPAKDYSGEKDNATGAYARASRGFMGKTWDGGDIAFRPETWAKVLRVLKPGGHLIAFGGTRTYHRMACAIEDAGLEIREMHAWVFGSGFPKSLDVSKAIDKAAGAEREVIAAVRVKGGGTEHINRSNAATHKYRPDGYQKGENVLDVTAPATEAAKQWEGWGTATKPAMEPVCLARKPLSEKTVAANVLRWGTGALNIDATRVGYENDAPDPATNPLYRALNGYKNTSAPDTNSSSYSFRKDGGPDRNPSVLGRWPANICHDGSDEVLALFPQSKGQLADASLNPERRKTQNVYGAMRAGRAGEASAERRYTENGSTNFAALPGQRRNDEGSAARFFYSAKANATDRAFSKHPTVKPVDLMRWLVRMVTPPGGTVLDCFAGTGTTGHAALLEGFNAILIEREAEYQADIERRMALVFAGEIERAAHAKQESHESLPLFGADNAGGGARVSDSFTGSSPETPHRANRNDEVVTP